MKVIDLVNKLYNNEPIPRCCYKDFLIETNDDVGTIFLTGLASMCYSLNDEVEIIEDAEEDKEIKKIPQETINEYLWDCKGDKLYCLRLFVANILNDKLNKVIDAVNKLNKGE